MMSGIYFTSCESQQSKFLLQSIFRTCVRVKKIPLKCLTVKVNIVRFWAISIFEKRSNLERNIHAYGNIIHTLEKKRKRKALEFWSNKFDRELNGIYSKKHKTK